eukprot:gene25781-34364_t
MSCIPLPMQESPPVRETADSILRHESSLRYLVPDDPNTPYEMLSVIKKIVANNPGHLAGCLDINSSIKAARYSPY